MLSASKILFKVTNETYIREILPYVRVQTTPENMDLSLQYANYSITRKKAVTAAGQPLQNSDSKISVAIGGTRTNQHNII